MDRIFSEKILKFYRHFANFHFQMSIFSVFFSVFTWFRISKWNCVGLSIKFFIFFCGFNSNLRNVLHLKFSNFLPNFQIFTFNCRFLRSFSPFWPWFASSIELRWITEKILHFLLSFKPEFTHFFLLNSQIFFDFFILSLSNVVFCALFLHFRLHLQFQWDCVGLSRKFCIFFSVISTGI